MTDFKPGDLLPCPFCGSPARCRERAGYSEVACDGCNAIGPYGNADSEAVQRWNKRRSDGLRNWLKAERDKADDYARHHADPESVVSIVRRDTYKITEKQAEKLLDHPV